MAGPMGGPGRRHDAIGRPRPKLKKGTIKRMMSYFKNYKIHMIAV